MYIGHNIINKIYSIFRVRSNLAYQLQFWAIVAVILPSFAFIVTEIVREIKHSREDAHNYLKQVVILQQETINQWLISRSADIQGIAQLRSVRSLDEQAMEQDFRAIIGVQSDFYNRSFVNRQGHLMISAVGTNGADVSDRDYFQQAMNGTLVISEILQGRLSSEPRIIFAAPIFDYQGEIQGVLTGSVKLDTISKTLEQFRFGRTGETYLTMRDGLMITEARFSQDLIRLGVVIDTVKLKLHLHESTVERFYRSESDSGEPVDYRGKDVLFAYQVMPGRNWVIVGEINQEEVMERIYSHLE